jgi:hypothetical protein
VCDDEEHIESPKPDRLNYQKIRGPDALQLILQERSPPLGANRAGAPPTVIAESIYCAPRFPA